MRFLVTVQMLIETDSTWPEDESGELRASYAEDEAFDFVDELLIGATKKPEFLAGQIEDIKRTIRRKL